MKRTALALILIFALFVSLVIGVQSVKSSPKTIIVPDDYATIQAAVGNATSGDTVYVRSGMYAGGIALTKPLSLVGEDSKTTIIVGGVTLNNLSYASSGKAITPLRTPESCEQNKLALASKSTSTTNPVYGANLNVSLSNFIPPPTYAIYINSSDITVSGFTIEGGSYAISGNGDRLKIYRNILGTCSLSGSNITVANNTGQPLSSTISLSSFTLEIGGSFNLITGNTGTITLSSSNSTVTGNVLNGYIAFIMQHADSNIIINNTFSGANEGLDIGFYGKACSYNLIAGNKVEDAGLWGILMGTGSYNVFYGNIVTNTGGLGHDGYALALGGTDVVADHNLFLHNIFVNNTKNFGVNWPVTGANSFDDGKEGNYWDDYLTKYPNATEIDHSGTGSIPYVLTDNNVDNHPLLTQPNISENVPALPAPWASLLPVLSASQSPSPSLSPRVNQPTVQAELGYTTAGVALIIGVAIVAVALKKRSKEHK